jgi:hypothetical protein
VQNSVQHAVQNYPCYVAVAIHLFLPIPCSVKIVAGRVPNFPFPGLMKYGNYDHQASTTCPLKYDTFFLNRVNKL